MLKCKNPLNLILFHVLQSSKGNEFDSFPFELEAMILQSVLILVLFSFSLICFYRSKHFFLKIQNFANVSDYIDGFLKLKKIRHFSRSQKCLISIHNPSLGSYKLPLQKNLPVRFISFSRLLETNK